MPALISCNDITVSESSSYAEFVLRLSEPATAPVAVNYRLDNLTTTSSDYTFSSGTLSFAPGVVVQTLRIPLNNDVLVEKLESFALNLSNATNAILADDQAIATIVDNDTIASTANKASLSVRDVVVDEKAGTATFDIVLDKAVPPAFNVVYGTAGATAVAGSDYTAASGTVAFAAGQTVQRVTVNIADDATAELEEQFVLNVSTISGAGAGMVQLADQTGTALIGRGDQTAVATPTITAADMVVSESEGYAEFVVTLSAPGAALVSVNYRLDGMTANSSDYASTSGTLSFAPGVTTQTVRVALTDDLAVEKPESLALNLSAPANAVLGTNQAIATIIDNDTLATATSKASLSVRDVVVDEKAGTATFDIVLDKAVADTFTVAYSTATGTAVGGADYVPASGTISFAAGQTVQRVTVNILDDAAAESEEQFQLNLGAVGGNAADLVQVADGSSRALIGRNDQTALATPTISAGDITVSESEGYAEFVVRLNAPGAAQVSVNYRLDNLNTTSSDYAFTSGTLSFAPGATTQTVRVALTDDLTAEKLESFALNLSAPTNAVLADDQAIATIVDNDTIASATSKASLSVRDVVVDEKEGTATFDIVLDKAVQDTFSVTYSLASAGAAAGSDYTASSGTIGFAAGQTVQRVTVAITDDAVAELEEQFNLNLGSITGAGAALVQFADRTGSAFIGRGDQTAIATPSITASDLTVSESAGYAEFVVKLNAPATTQVSVDYRVEGMTANSSDYGFTTGTLSFAPGVTTQTVRVALTDDLIAEKLESLSLNLSAPTNGIVADNQAIATLVDNDTLADSANKASLSVRDVVVDEKAGTATFAIVLDKAVSDAFTVVYATADGNAAGGSDYLAASGTIGFAAGQTVQHVTVSITDDATAEANEQFQLNLGAIAGNAAGLVQLADGSGTASIVQNDGNAVATPVISASDIIVSEAGGYAEFVITLSAPGTSQASVNYRLDNLTTTSSDYAFSSGTLSFSPGVTAQVVRVALTDDLGAEKLESFALNLSAATNAVLADDQAIATIVDNDLLADGTGKASLSVRDVVVDETTGTATFEIVLDKAVSDTFGVAYATTNRSAVAGQDYAAASGTIVFAAGQTAQRVTVNITDDAAAELEEQFQLDLGAISGNAASLVQIGDGSGTALIGRSDQAATARPSISVSDIVVSETDGYAEFVVRLNAPGAAEASVDYRIDGMTANSSDYAFTAGTLSFAPGVTTQTVRVALADDLTVEKLENLALSLSAPTNAVIADNQALATIVDNDTLASAAERAGLSVRDVVVDEQAGTATFNLVLDKAVQDTFSVAYTTTGVTAVAGSDYTGAFGTLSFAAGQTVQRVTVNITDDAAVEGQERFQLNLGALTGNAAAQVRIADGSGNALIGLSDGTALATPSISAADITVNEADGYAEFIVTLAAPGTTQASVNYRIDNVTTTSSDYGFTSGTLSFAPGVTTQTVRVSLTDDLVADPLERFALNLSGAVNATLADSQAIATIVDNDQPASLAGADAGADMDLQLIGMIQYG